MAIIDISVFKSLGTKDALSREELQSYISEVKVLLISIQQADDTTIHTPKNRKEIRWLCY